MSELAKYKISNIEWLTDNLLLISFEKYNHLFKAGQHVTLSTIGNYESREYSIFSGETDGELTLLIKIVDEGYFTPKLSSLKIGEHMVISKPHGSFSYQTQGKGRHWFIATGTGYAPMNSMIRSNKDVDFKLVHGVRTQKEALSSVQIDIDKCEICVSREDGKSKYRRVTEYIRIQEFLGDEVFYLCGNGSMVYDCKNLLRDKGVNPDSIYTEVYF
jgi:ferredoxin/flavodoxin---NADP+ reductase